MMFGAGIGIGMLTFATAEPMYHFASNPSTIQGITEGSTAGNVRDAYIWSFTHWGLAAWSAYAIVGLALGYFSYRRGLPLTIRSALTPIFGKRLSGPLGHVVDVVAVVATVLGVSQTLGFGVEQFISGLSRIGFGDWLFNIAEDGTRTSSNAGIIVALIVIMGASTLSALSGVGKGIKWLSNINMVLSFFVLAFFLVFGSTFFGLTTLFVGIWDYLISIPGNFLTVWSADGTETGDALAGWQGGWTIFYWAWWIAFAPFVGVFLARISKGRTIREYVLGAMIVPAFMCFVWFALVGGTAIDLELTGVADGAIAGAGQADQLFAMLAVILSETLAYAMSVVVVILLLTYLVTSADSCGSDHQHDQRRRRRGPEGAAAYPVLGCGAGLRGGGADHRRGPRRDPDRDGDRGAAVQPRDGADGPVADQGDLPRQPAAEARSADDPRRVRWHVRRRANRSARRRSGGIARRRGPLRRVAAVRRPPLAAFRWTSGRFSAWCFGLKDGRGVVTKKGQAQK